MNSAQHYFTTFWFVFVSCRMIGLSDFSGISIHSILVVITIPQAF